MLEVSPTYFILKSAGFSNQRTLSCLGTKFNDRCDLRGQTDEYNISTYSN